MSETEILIRDRDDLRPGDVLRVWPRKHPDRWSEGPIWISSTNAWLVGGRYLRRGDGQWEADIDLATHPARRTVPPVDPAQVEALAELLDEVIVVSPLSLRDIAQHLMETGRVGVKP